MRTPTMTISDSGRTLRSSLQSVIEYRPTRYVPRGGALVRRASGIPRRRRGAA